MNKELLSPLEIRSILRVCYYLIQDCADVELWTAFQKHLLLTEQSQLGVLLRQLKKVDPQILTQIKDGFAPSQIESKLWLMDILKAVLPTVPQEIYVCGSWFGLLSRMLHWGYAKKSTIISVDLDDRWQSVAKSINEPESYLEKAVFLAEDAKNLERMIWLADHPLVINTSCEHFERFDEWYASLPDGCIVALQANSEVDYEGHVRHWKTLSEFSEHIKLSVTLFEGQLELPRYSRFMLIGAK